MLTAKKLILGLLLASEGRALSASELVRACALFGTSAGGTRVALTRLSAEQKVESAGRGMHRLGPAARGLRDELVGWRQAEGRLQPWGGDYLMAFTANLGRRDRTVLRRRERALEMLGFRELSRGLHARPHNISTDAETVARRLRALGVEPECPVFVATDFDGARRRALEGLWDGAALDRHYAEAHCRLSRWMDDCASLSPDAAARESYLLGSEAIRSLVFDPWLPAPFVDVDARHAFFDTVCRFDDHGKAIWRELTQSTPPPRSPASDAPRGAGPQTERYH